MKTREEIYRELYDTNMHPRTAEVLADLLADHESRLPVAQPQPSGECPDCRHPEQHEPGRCIYARDEVGGEDTGAPLCDCTCPQSRGPAAQAQPAGEACHPDPLCEIPGCTKYKETLSAHCPEHRAKHGRTSLRKFEPAPQEPPPAPTCPGGHDCEGKCVAPSQPPAPPAMPRLTRALDALWNPSWWGTQRFIAAARADLAQLTAAKDSRIEQLETQLAGVSVAALGGTREPVTAKRGQWGWSVAYQDTLDLRRKYEALEAKLAAATLDIERYHLREADWNKALAQSEEVRVAAEAKLAAQGEPLTSDEISVVVDEWASCPFPAWDYKTIVQQENAGTRQLAEMAAAAQLAKGSRPPDGWAPMLTVEAVIRAMRSGRAGVDVWDKLDDDYRENQRRLYEREAGAVVAAMRAKRERAVKA